MLVLIALTLGLSSAAGLPSKVILAEDFTATW